MKNENGDVAMANSCTGNLELELKLKLELQLEASWMRDLFALFGCDCVYQSAASWLALPLSLTSQQPRMRAKHTQNKSRLGGKKERSWRRQEEVKGGGRERLEEWRVGSGE